MEETGLEKKWCNYFNNMRNKYNMRVSASKPLIVFLDAKDSSKNNITLLKGSKNDFFDTMELSAKYFTRKYNCIAIWGTDEISFIINDVTNFISTINNDNKYRTHDIVSIFSQYFFEYFNNIYKGNTVYWHCNCFNIAEEKIKSYIKFKSNGILKGVTSIFLKNNSIRNAYGIKLKEKLKMCEKYDTYQLITDYKYGSLYYNGNRIDMKEFFNDSIVTMESQKEDVEIFDLLEFDKLL